VIPKNCTRCGNLALVSISFLVSTVNRPERKQKCGKAVLLCDVCIREFLRVLRVVSPSAVYEHAREAYTQISCERDANKGHGVRFPGEKQPN
jgi:hypothetical protein